MPLKMLSISEGSVAVKTRLFLKLSSSDIFKQFCGAKLLLFFDIRKYLGKKKSRLLRLLGQTGVC